MTRYTRTDCAVLDNGTEIASAVDEITAAQIVNALNDQYERLVAARNWLRDNSAAHDIHHVRREQDEMVCTCGLRWSTDERDPHTAS